MLPIIPFLLIPYSEILNRIKFMQKILPLFIIVLFFVDIVISHRHQEFLIKQTHYQNKLYKYTKDADMIICNKDIYELINPFIKSIKWEPFESEGRLIERFMPDDNQKIYLACLTRDDNIKSLFYELLLKTEPTKEIYKEEIPQYFSIHLKQNK